MKTKTLITAGIFGVLVLIFSGFCCTRIDAGNVGIRVKMYGTDKGVSDVTEVTGYVWYNPFSEQVYEFPTFVQNAAYSATSEEGEEGNTEIVVTTSDGSVVRFDVTLHYRVEQSSVPSIFKKYRRPLPELSNGVIRNYVRKAYNTTASKYRAEDLYSQRGKFEAEAEILLRGLLESEGFLVDNLQIVGSLRLPGKIAKAIDDKIQADQIAAKKKAEQQQAYWDAQKTIEKARGDSLSYVIRAAGKAESYRIQRQELTPAMLDKLWINKWNGVLPATYAGDESSFLLKR